MIRAQYAIQESEDTSGIVVGIAADDNENIVMKQSQDMVVISHSEARELIYCLNELLKGEENDAD